MLSSASILSKAWTLRYFDELQYRLIPKVKRPDSIVGSEIGLLMLRTLKTGHSAGTSMSAVGVRRLSTAIGSGGCGSKVLVRAFAFQPLAGLSVGGKVSSANLTGAAQAICGAWRRTMPAGNV